MNRSLLLGFFMVLAACSSSTSSGGLSDGPGSGTPDAGSDPGKNPGPTNDAGPSGGGDGGGGTDAGTDSGPAVATLAIQSGTYKNTTAAGGGFVYAITFQLSNTSASAIISLDKVVFDFGGGNQVTVTKACNGNFGIPAGGKRVVDTQIVVSNAGSVTNFAIICGSSQFFGGASGKAPGVSTFADPVTITATGTTTDGTFIANGTAARSN